MPVAVCSPAPVRWVQALDNWSRPITVPSRDELADRLVCIVVVVFGWVFVFAVERRDQVHGHHPDQLRVIDGFRSEWSTRLSEAWSL
jgi:hypothetical protein